MSTGRDLAFLEVLHVLFHPAVGLFQDVERFLNFIVVGLGQLHLRVDVLVLILDDLDVVFSRPLVVLNLSFLRLKLGLGHLKFLDLLLKLGDRLKMGLVLVFEHLLSLPISIQQELVHLHKDRRVLTIRFQY